MTRRSPVRREARAGLGYSPVYDLAAGLETLAAGK